MLEFLEPLARIPLLQPVQVVVKLHRRFGHGESLIVGVGQLLPQLPKRPLINQNVVDHQQHDPFSLLPHPR